LLTAYRMLENTVIIVVVVVVVITDTGCTIYRTDLLLIVDKKWLIAELLTYLEMELLRRRVWLDTTNGSPA